MNKIAKQQSISTSISNINNIRDKILKTLVADVDYGKIAGLPKPCLYKAGAEKILLYLGIEPEYQIITSIKNYNYFNPAIEMTIEMKEKSKNVKKTMLVRAYIDYAFKVKGFKNMEGTRISIKEGYGSCNSLEKPWGKERATPWNVDNSILKKAKKRALVDMALSLSGLSEIMTQDLDDTGALVKSIKLDLAGKYEKMALYTSIYTKIGKDTKNYKEVAKKAYLNPLLEKLNKEFSTSYKSLMGNLTKEHLAWVKKEIENG